MSEPDAALTPALRERIEAECARFPERRGGLLGALHAVHAEYGFASPGAMRELADLFDVTPLEVLELVRFYTMFHDAEQGRHQVRVCTSLSCSLRGARSILDALEEALGVRAGETSADGRVTLGHEECLGACAGAPALRVDAEVHEDLDPAEAQRLVEALD